MKLGTKDPAMLIGGTVEPVTVASVTHKGIECAVDGNGKLSYEGTNARMSIVRLLLVMCLRQNAVNTMLNTSHRMVLWFVAYTPVRAKTIANTRD